MLSEKIEIKKESYGNYPYEKTTIRLVKNNKDIGYTEIKHYSNTKVSELSSVRIDENYRDKGLSNILLKETVRDIDERGFIAELDIVAREKSIKKLEHIYQKYGFEGCAKKVCASKENKENPFCTQPFFREGKIYKKESKEYQSEKKKWCVNR